MVWRESKRLEVLPVMIVGMAIPPELVDWTASLPFFISFSPLQPQLLLEEYGSKGDAVTRARIPHHQKMPFEDHASTGPKSASIPTSRPPNLCPAFFDKRQRHLPDEPAYAMVSRSRHFFSPDALPGAPTRAPLPLERSRMAGSQGSLSFPRGTAVIQLT